MQNALKTLTILLASIMMLACADTHEGDPNSPVNAASGTPTSVLPPSMAPASVVSIMTLLEKSPVEAGEWSKVTCIVTDDKGVTADVKAQITVPAEVMTNDSAVKSQKAGIYEIRCQLAGLTLEESPAMLTVRAAAPVSVSLTASPAKTVYALGDQVALNWTISDTFGNTVDDHSATLSGPTVLSLIHISEPTRPY